MSEKPLPEARGSFAQNPPAKVDAAQQGTSVSAEYKDLRLYSVGAFGGLCLAAIVASVAIAYMVVKLFEAYAARGG